MRLQGETGSRCRFTLLCLVVLSALLCLTVLQLQPSRPYTVFLPQPRSQQTKTPETSTKTPKPPTKMPAKAKQPAMLKKTNYFTEVMSKEDQEVFKSVLQSFVSVLPANMTYFLYGGTLLGSWRHHGVIPWDDDLDLLVRKKDRSGMEAAIKTLGPGYGLGEVMKEHQVKFYRKNTTATAYEWYWPFLDIFFYDENNKTIWDSYPANSWAKFKKKDVFPLQNRPFMGLSLPCPKDPPTFLKTMRIFDGCQTPSYNHKREKPRKIPRVNIPCEYLKDRFPFVERRHTANGTVEVLVLPAAS